MSAGRKGVFLLALVLVVGMGGAASAQSVGSGLRVATPGAGLEVESLLSDQFGIRALTNGGLVSYDYYSSGLQFDGRSRFGASLLLADWHPYASGFRLSGGLAYNNQYVPGATPADRGALSNFSRASYSSTQLGSLDSGVSFSRASPYFGVGWGLASIAGSRLYFSADLGVLYQRPSASLTGSCGPALPASVCAQLQNDLRAEEAELRDADQFRFYPVISVGFGLRF